MRQIRHGVVGWQLLRGLSTQPLVQWLGMYTARTKLKMRATHEMSSPAVGELPAVAVVAFACGCGFSPLSSAHTPASGARQWTFSCSTAQGTSHGRSATARVYRRLSVPLPVPGRLESLATGAAGIFAVVVDVDRVTRAFQRRIPHLPARRESSETGRDQLYTYMFGW